MRSPPPDTVPTCTPTRAQADDATALCADDSESVFCTQAVLHEDGPEQPGAYGGFMIFQNYCQISTSFTTGFSSALKQSLKQDTKKGLKASLLFCSQMFKHTQKLHPERDFFCVLFQKSPFS